MVEISCASGTVVSPAGVQLLLAKGCGLNVIATLFIQRFIVLCKTPLSLKHSALPLSWEALGRKLLTAVGCAVASRSPPSTSSITRYTSGFHNLILLSSRASYRRRCELALTAFLSCAPIVLVTFNACSPTNARTWFLLRVNKTMKHRRTYGIFCFPLEATEEYVSPSEKSISRF